VSRNLKFFFFGYQCPHNAYLLARIKTIAFQESAHLQIHDISNDGPTCEKYRIFSPTMLLVNDKYRWHGPFSRETVLEMLDEDIARPKAYSVRQSDEAVTGELVAITSKSVLSTCQPCIGSDDSGLCWGKSEWVESILRSSGRPHIGYLHFHEGKCVGGAEFLPSRMVPYPIPDKMDDDAFLTCSYLSDAKRDFRSHPLAKLEDDLRAWGFRTLSVAASNDVVFPNGPVNWFEKRGFKDKGTLVTEPLHNAEIHYLQLGL